MLRKLQPGDTCESTLKRNKRSPHGLLVNAHTLVLCHTRCFTPTLPRCRALPSSSDETAVLSRADVLQDKGLVAGGQVNVGQIGFADIQPVGGVLASGQLEDVGDESRHTQTKDVDACEKTSMNISGGEPLTR